MQHARILVVDDNEDNRYALIRRLARLGYANVAAAVNGRQALEQLAAGPVDLVLLDIMMPEMNGYDVLEHMHTDMQLRDIPVIMISAVDDIESIARCINLGAADYLNKPFNPILVKARVGACLTQKLLRDQEAAYREELELERRKVEDLLAAVLPPSAARELKATGGVTPRRYEDVAVLFCDIVSFTPYCDKHAPEKVVSELQSLVEAFEEIVERHQLEKVKTIGDAFMATAGLLNTVQEPVVASVRCGLEMVVKALELEPGWQLRVGIHQGAVVAGIIGGRQYGFDLWGDTVNVAARVMGKANPGTVVVTAPTWQRVRSRIKAKSLGILELKGKGSMEVVECLEVL